MGGIVWQREPTEAMGVPDQVQQRSSGNLGKHRHAQIAHRYMPNVSKRLQFEAAPQFPYPENP